MPAPTSTGLRDYLGLPSLTAGQTEAFGAAMSWARKTLGRAPTDDLDDLELDNVRAVYGYASDLVKLPRTQFGYFAAEDATGELAAAVGDVGRRWAGMLTFGHRTGVSFA